MKAGRRRAKPVPRAEPYRRHACRCTKCGRRVNLARHPEEYKTTKPCPHCGGRLRVDKYRMGKERGAISVNTCNCGFYHFPHARGRGWCQHNLKLTDSDLEHMAETRRSTRR